MDRADAIPLAVLYLAKNSGNYQLAQGIRLDSFAYSYGGYYTITDAPHYIEMYLIRSTGAGDSNGSLQLWVDGVSKETLTGKDNYDIFTDVGQVRMGAILGVDAGTSGTFYLDELVVNDDGGAIGPYIPYPSVTIAPTSASAVGANLGPTVNLGSLSIAPVAAGAVASRLGPTVKLSSLSIAPTPASSIGSRTNPNTLLGSIIISPTPAAAIAAYANPTVVIEGEEAAVIKDQTYFLFWSVMFRKKKRRNNRIVYVKK